MIAVHKYRLFTVQLATNWELLGLEDSKFITSMLHYKVKAFT